MTKVLIATPAYGQTFFGAYVESVMKLVGLMYQKRWEFQFEWISYAEISESRNYLLTHWIDKTDASHLLFVDADMGFEPQLIADMIAFDKPVVGTAYPKRNIDVRRVARAARSVGPDLAVVDAQEYVVRPLKERTRNIKGFVEVEGCGAGILLLQRSCVETMLHRIPGLSDEKIKRATPLTAKLDRLIRAFDVLDDGGRRMSEDFSFCYRWRRQCDGQIWVNTEHTIRHIGLFEFVGRYGDKLMRPPVVSPGRSVTGRLVLPSRFKERADRNPKK